jgi:chloramphenicol-sensitive protein RarD
VLVLSVAYGRVPFLAIGLAVSFTVYGYVKKTVNIPTAESLTVETAVMFLPSVGYLSYLAWTGEGTFGTGSANHSLMLVGAGVVTAIPLLCFGAAATRVPLSTIGMLQYLAPVLQFAIGVWIKDEPMPGSRWAGFGLIWGALALLTYDALRQAGRNRTAAGLAASSAAAASASAAAAAVAAAGKAGLDSGAPAAVPAAGRGQSFVK